MNIDEFLKNMTIEEKLSLIVGSGFSKKVNGAAGETRAINSLNIPSIVLSDGPAGIRISPFRAGSSNIYYATAFPNAIVLASTWNLDIVETVGRAIGEEAKDYGVDVMLAPGLNIQRIPLCGRNFEYFSEDPLLSGKMAAAYVKGVQSIGVGATLKHFVANEQEMNRMAINIVVSERALREIYLRAFEITIEESKPWAIMASYNKVNGKYATQNEWLLTKVLREEWGFDGLVMTDWGAGDNPIEQIKAGIDLVMPGSDEILQSFVEAYKNGLIDEKSVNERAKKVLELVYKSLTYKGNKPSNNPDLNEHAKTAYESAIEGFVLLKNDNALPITKEAKVSLFGQGSYMTVKGGLGSGNVHPKYVISIADGLREKGVKVNEELERIYKSHPYVGIGKFYQSIFNEISKGRDIQIMLPFIVEILDSLVNSYSTNVETKLEEALIEKVAKEDDIAIITISRISSEGWDRRAVKGDFYLSDNELELIKKVSDAFHKHGKKVVVILNIPSPIEIVSWRDFVDAILVVWTPGQEAGRAVADVLLGMVNVSGKLPFTWPKDLYDLPTMRTYPGVPKGNPQYLVYEEDIYVGYRYNDTFEVEPAYEFGYGLSYTKFEYSDLSVEKEEKGDKIKVSLKVKNVGQFDGKEVVQVYVRAPRGKLNKPFQELKGFFKTKLLKPNEEESVTIEIPVKHLASFNGLSWIVEGGEYEMRVGSSSRDIRLEGKVVIEEQCFDVRWNKISC